MQIFLTYNYMLIFVIKVHTATLTRLGLHMIGIMYDPDLNMPRAYVPTLVILGRLKSYLFYSACSNGEKLRGKSRQASLFFFGNQ